MSALSPPWPHCLLHSAKVKKLFLLPAQPPYSNLNMVEVSQS